MTNEADNPQGRDSGVQETGECNASSQDDKE